MSDILVNIVISILSHMVTCLVDSVTACHTWNAFMYIRSIHTFKCVCTCIHKPTHPHSISHSSLEYDPSLYGLYLHDEVALPRESKLWDYLDQRFASGYQDTLVLHLEPSPLKVQLAGEEERCVQLHNCNVTFVLESWLAAIHCVGYC